MKMETIERVRLYIGQKAPRPVYTVACFFRKIYKLVRMPEQRKSYGELNPDKTFYVIRLFPPGTGWLANYIYVLGYMKYAYEKGWIPVVDMENYGTLYQESEAVHGTRNVWEYWFLQPDELGTGKRYSLEEVYKSKNVILANASKECYVASMDREVLQWQYEMAQHVPFNEHTQRYIEKQLESIPIDRAIIGVPTRGSEQKKRVIGHHIPATVNDLIPLLRKYIVQWGDDRGNARIFVKAEENEAIDMLREVFPDIIYTEGTRITNYDGKAPASNANTQSSRYQSILEYMTDIYILSKCDGLIGSFNNGFYTAILWNNNMYKHIEIVDKGIYK